MLLIIFGVVLIYAILIVSSYMSVKYHKVKGVGKYYRGGKK